MKETWLWPVQLRSRKAPIDAEWRWPTRGLSCDFQLHQITKKEWRRDKESCWWKCVFELKQDAFRRITEFVLKWYPGLDFRLPARWGSEAPLLVLWRDGLLDHCRIGTGCWSAWITGWFFFRKKRIWTSRPKHKVNGLVGNHIYKKSFFKGGVCAIYIYYSQSGILSLLPLQWVFPSCSPLLVHSGGAFARS